MTPTRRSGNVQQRRGRWKMASWEMADGEPVSGDGGGLNGDAKTEFAFRTLAGWCRQAGPLFKGFDCNGKFRQRRR